MGLGQTVPEGTRETQDSLVIGPEQQVAPGSWQYTMSVGSGGLGHRKAKTSFIFLIALQYENPRSAGLAAFLNLATQASPKIWSTLVRAFSNVVSGSASTEDLLSSRFPNSGLSRTLRERRAVSGGSKSVN